MLIVDRNSNENEDAVIQRYNLRGYDGTNNFDPSSLDRIRWKSPEFEEWSAPFISNPEILKEYIAASGLNGAIIHDIGIAGDCVVEFNKFSYFKYLEDLRGNEAKAQKEFAEFDKGILYWQIKCHTPIIIITNKGNFEVWFNLRSLLRMSKNKIPEGFYGTKPGKEFDVRKIFANIRGKKITKIEIDDGGFSPFDEDYCVVINSYLDKYNTIQPPFIKTVDLVLDNEQILSFTDGTDMGCLSVLNEQRAIITMPEGGASKYLKDL